MITVHHLENSRSQRILWLLEELGLDYSIEKYHRDPITSLAPARLLELHPLGKAPVVMEGENTLAESGAIIDYLIEKYDDGRLRPVAKGIAAKVKAGFLERIRARPAYQRALEKGGPYELLGTSTK